MSEAVQNLVNAIAAGSAVDTESAFHAAMQEKLAGKMEDRYQEISKSMFNQLAPAAEQAETTEQE